MEQTWESLPLLNRAMLCPGLLGQVQIDFIEEGK
jgi:hypothetical protein